ncbi:spore gernimation protein GerT [Priestia megaterium]|nr:spore gernimation protein GerT [Priestia megaterium]
MFPFGKFPFKNQGEGFNGNLNPKNIDQYVQQVLSNAMGQSFPGFMKNNEFFKQAQQMYDQQLSQTKEQHTKLQPTIFETHEECIIQLPLQNKEAVQQLKVAHTPYSCMIEGYYDDEPFREEWKLPCSVSRKGSKASYRNGILEIKLIKYHNLPVTEIDVHGFD